MLAAVNAGLRFVLELAGIVAVAWWGVHAADGAAGWLLGIGAAVAFIAVWGLFVAPRARYPQTPRVRLIVGTAILEVAALLLGMSGSTTAAAILAGLVALNAVAIAVLGDGGLTEGSPP
jgi:hypothetical protein